MNRRWAPPRWPAQLSRSTATPRPWRWALPGRCAIPWTRFRRAISRWNIWRPATILATNLSRLAGELVQWSTPAFGFVKLSDAFTTGSSIMPQKRNPDAAELIRGKTGRVLGDFVALATVVKGLVLTYGTDLQEDKERVFDAADTVELSLAAMAAMIADLTADPEKMRAAAEPGYPTATDLADWLVRVLKKPFREAHHIAGSIVKLAEDKGVTLDKLPLADMQSVEPGITKDVLAVLSLEALGQFAHEPGRHRAGAGEGTDCLLAGTSEMKTRILLLILALGLTVAACGVKNDLTRPDGTTDAQGHARSVQAALSHRPLGDELFFLSGRHSQRRRGFAGGVGARGRHAFLLLFQRHPGAALQSLCRGAAAGFAGGLFGQGQWQSGAC